MKKVNLKLGKMKKSIYAAAAVVTVMFFNSVVHAQSIGTAVDDARTQIAGIKGSVGTLILALGGVIGLVGAIRVFIKWNNGDQDVQKSLIGWGGACIFLLLSGTLITSFFG